MYHTSSLASTSPGIDKWNFEHALDCIAWIVDEMTQHHHHIDTQELWFETSGNLTIQVGDDMAALFDVDQMKNISEIDLCPQSDNGNTSSRVINSRYLRQYRLNQRRRWRQLTIFSDEDEGSMSHVHVPSP